jgi:hypothetical protein
VPNDCVCPTAGQTIAYALSELVDVGKVDNYLTKASDYGDITEYWQGIELTVNARMNNGVTLQGGFSDGAGTRDNCASRRRCPSC